MIKIESARESESIPSSIKLGSGTIIIVKIATTKNTTLISFDPKAEDRIC